MNGPTGVDKSDLEQRGSSAGQLFGQMQVLQSSTKPILNCFGFYFG